MTTLSHKIDFSVVLRVRNANPNGDPLNGNRPRTDFANIGEISDVCLKRKLRNALLLDGQAIFVQSDDRKIDDATSLRDRAEKGLGSKLGGAETQALACKKWFDVRAFGQLFALPKAKKKAKAEGEGEDETDTGVSIGIRGPVTLHSAFSVEPIEVTSLQITKSVSGEGDGTKRGADTMGMKHRVDYGIYVFHGSMNPQLAERTGFSDADADAIKQILPRLFENDESSARPAGSMEIIKVIWWQHDSKIGRHSSAKVHHALTVAADGGIALNRLDGLEPEIIEGF